MLFKNNSLKNNVVVNNCEDSVKTTKKYLKNNFTPLSEETEKFIVENNRNIKDIINDLKIKFNINIHQKQIVNVMHKNKKNIKSFFKITPIIQEFILKKIKENCIFTSLELQNVLFNEFKMFGSKPKLGSNV